LRFVTYQTVAVWKEH